ncbi:MFS transporter [Raoultella sp. T31]|uniref:MFS transporter n=1 Tax=Raoultella sp. T31 TaxID=2054594 RepID=UPI000C289BA6|nr:oxalate/formate antiport family MFS transporter [Raoultella sp. T31]
MTHKQDLRQASQPVTRWLTFTGTLLAQFALGSVYTWSLFNSHFATQLHTTVPNVAFTFGILCLCLAFASSFAGRLQDKFGVKVLTIFSGIALLLGLGLTGIAHSLTMLWIFGGVLVGLADGIGYLLTLTNCIRWFPERKGLISALSIGCYGVGSLAFKFINMDLLANNSLHTALLYWGVIAAVVCIIGGILMTDAPYQNVKVASGAIQKEYTLREAVCTAQFWMLCLMFGTAMMGGLYIIGVAKDIAQTIAHLDGVTAANAVTVVAVANLVGRLVMGIMSDSIRIIRIVTFGQIILLVGMVLLNFCHLNEYSFFFALGCVAFNFGGHLTTFPSLVAEFFGLNNVTKNYGVIYLGFGIGSFLGSVIASVFGGFQSTFWVIFVLAIISIIFSLTVKRPANTEDDSYIPWGI